MEELKVTKKVTLDKERTLRMDFNALVKAEEITGHDFLTGETWRKMRAADYRALVYACLLDEDASLTLEQVGRMITMQNEKVLSDAILELYVASATTPIDDKATAEAPFGSAGSGGGRTQESASHSQQMSSGS